MPFESNRHFQLWDYTVSHQQLLFRSPKSPTESDNIDLLFRGVDYFEAPTSFEGVELSEGSPEMTEDRGLGTRGSFVLTTAGRRYLIVAAFFHVLRNDLDLFESSLEYFDDRYPIDRDLGTVLARSYEPKARQKLSP